MVRGSARQAAIATSVNQIVRLPRWRRAASYAAQFVTLCCCLGMWRRQAALALNGTAGIQASGKGLSSYTAQLPTPTGRSVQQGGVASVSPLLRPRLARSVPTYLGQLSTGFVVCAEKKVDFTN